MSRPTAAVVASLALALSLGCSPRKPVAPTGGGGGGDTTGVGGGGGGGGGGDVTPLAPVSRIAELLPPRTMLMMEVASPNRIAEIIGRDALVKQFPTHYAKLAGELVENLGSDLLDPARIKDIGVDVDGRMGMAVVSLEPLTMAFFVRLSDPARFRQFTFDAIRRNKGDVVAVPMAGAEVLRVKDERSAIVLRGPFAALVVQDRDAKGDIALDVAGADPHASLANDREFRKATGALGSPDWLTYLDAAAIWAQVGDERETPAETGNWARDELAAAKQRGESPQRLAELEAQAKQVDLDNARWARRRAAERTLRERMFTGVGKAAWSVSAKPTGLVAEGRIEYADEALFALLFRNRAGESSLPKALSGRPMWLMNGTVDVAQALDFADLWLQSEGASMAEVSAELVKAGGIDLAAELRPLLSGSYSFAVTLDGKFDTRPGHEADAIGLAVDVELADASKADALLERVGKMITAENGKHKGSKPELTMRKGKDGWLLSVPKLRPLHVGVFGHHLVIATDAGLGKRLQSGAAGDAKGKGSASALAAASIVGSAFGGLLDFELVGLTMLGRPFSSGPVEIESPEDAKVPKSKAYKARAAEVEKARKRVDAVQAERFQREMDAIGKVVSPWGSLAGSVVEEGDSMVVRGGLFVRGRNGVAGALLESLEALQVATDDNRNDDRMAPAFDELNAAQQRAREQRQRDVEAWRKKHGGGSGSGAVVPVPPQ